MFRISILTLILFSSLPLFAQTETVDNKTVADMSRSGLSSEIILKKIASSRTAFDVSAASLIVLKKAGVDDIVFAEIMDRSQTEASAGSDPTFWHLAVAPVLLRSHDVTLALFQKE